MKQEETKIDKSLLPYIGISLAVHCVFFVFFLWSFSSLNIIKPQEFSADFIISDIIETENKETKEELLSDKLLPQLPKKFKIKEAKVIDKSLSTVPGKKKIIQAKENKRKEKMIELTKKEAIKRLLKDKAKKDRKIKLKDKKIKNLAKKISSETKKLRQKLDYIKIAGLSNSEGYNAVLRSWLQKYYTIPSSYNYSLAKYPAKLILILDKKGLITKLDLIKSSKYSLYDKLLLKLIKQAEPFPLPPKSNVGKKMILSFALHKKI
jgi:outer membrane biosynthesis protein TonB